MCRYLYSSVIKSHFVVLSWTYIWSAQNLALVHNKIDFSYSSLPTFESIFSKYSNSWPCRFILQFSNFWQKLLPSTWIVMVDYCFDRRLSKVISVLSKNQPSCPQLYLYSFADRVIPAESVENFIKEQKTLGRDVYAYNFGSSPHVDHFRSFPRLYTAKIDEFLKICSLATVWSCFRLKVCFLLFFSPFHFNRTTNLGRSLTYNYVSLFFFFFNVSIFWLLDWLLACHRNAKMIAP